MRPRFEAKWDHTIYGYLKTVLISTLNYVTPKYGKKCVYPSLDDDTRFKFEVQVDVVHRAVDLLEKCQTSEPSDTVRNIYGFSTAVPMKPNFSTDILNRVHRLLISLFDKQHFSMEEYRAYLEEVERVDYICVFFLIQSLPLYTRRPALVADQSVRVNELLLKSTKKLTEEDKKELKSILKVMGEKLYTGLGITETERTEILRSIGLSKGQWFKCPNGHIYAIGECGGAMQIGRCNECGAAIGGQSHTLLSSNTIAREMDGASYAAWSEQANMHNYRF